MRMDNADVACRFLRKAKLSNLVCDFKFYMLSDANENSW